MPLVIVLSIIFILLAVVSEIQGWRQEFSNRGLTLPKRGLKYGFQCILNAKNLRKIVFHRPKGASMFRQGL